MTSWLCAEAWTSNTKWFDIGMELKKDRNGNVILTSTEDGKETLISQITKPISDKIQDIKNKFNYYTKKEGPVPEALRWIPAVINYIDDAQDILITALNVAKPLLKFAPKPVQIAANWLLKASDKMDLATQTLAKAMTPLGIKHKLGKDTKHGKEISKDKLDRLKDFQKKHGWRDKLGAILQGLQASDTLTGYGLQIGAIMGAISDIQWATIKGMAADFNELLSGGDLRYAAESRKAHDAQEKAGWDLVNAVVKTGKDFWNDATRLFGYSRSTLEDKAARVLLQNNQLANIVHGLSDDDIITIITATRVATSILSKNIQPGLDYRTDAVIILPFPVCFPTNAVSVETLKSEGIDPYNTEPCISMHQGWPTLGWAMDDGIEAQPQLEAELRSRADKNPDKWGHVYNLWFEAGQESFDTLTGVNMDSYTEFGDIMKIALSMDDDNFMLVPPYTNQHLELLLLSAAKEAEMKGYFLPTENDWIAAAEKNKLPWKKKYEIH